VGVVVQVSRLPDGKRKVMSIQEVTGMEGEMITMQEIFSYKQTGLGDDGTVHGHHSPSGIRPRFIDRLRNFGVTVSNTVFEPS